MAPPDLLTAESIAKTLGVSDAKVKKAIQTLGIRPQRFGERGYNTDRKIRQA